MVKIKLIIFKRMVFIFILPLFFSGCWDYKDTEKRGYVLGIGIDTPEAIENTNFNNMQLESSGPLYAFTMQMPLTARSQNKPTGTGGSTNNERHLNITINSNAFFEANRQYATILEYPANYSHLESIVISEKVAREGISRIVDMFYRDPEMRRRTKVFITPETSKGILEVVPKISDYPSIYIGNLPRNSEKNSRIPHKTDFGRVAVKMHSSRNYILPRITSSGHEIKDAGCAVFKDNKMVGWLDEIKMNYLKWITNTALGGTVSFNMSENKEDIMVLELRKLKTKQIPIVKGDSITIKLETDARMNIAEVVSKKSYDTSDPKFIADIEKQAEQHITRKIIETIDYVKNNYKTDIFLFDDTMKRYQPKRWSEVENNWDDMLDDIKIDVNVKVRVNQFGLNRR